MPTCQQFQKKRDRNNDDQENKNRIQKALTTQQTSETRLVTKVKNLYGTSQQNIVIYCGL